METVRRQAELRTTIKPRRKSNQNQTLMRKITNKFRERKEVIQTANKFEKTKSKQTTVAFLLNFIEEVILICLIQTQIKNSQSVRRDVVKTTHYVKRLRRHLILKTQLMLHGIMWFCTQDRFLPKFS